MHRTEILISGINGVMMTDVKDSDQDYSLIYQKKQTTKFAFAKLKKNALSYLEIKDFECKQNR